MGWKRVADILTGMQARDVVVKASYARALKEESAKVRSERRSELDKRYISMHETIKKHPVAATEHTAFLRAYPVMKNVEFQQRVGVCPTPLLAGYLALFYNYIADNKMKEAGEAAKIAAPSIPSLPSLPSLPSIDVKLPSFSMPSIGLAGKGLIGVIVLIGLGLLALIALGYSGLGGSVGRVAESEHGRRRS